MNIKWHIEAIELDNTNESNTPIGAHWRIDTIDNEKQIGSFYGYTSIVGIDANNLNEEQVVFYVQNILGDDTVQEYESIAMSLTNVNKRIFPAGE